MPLRLGQLVYTSFPGVGFKTLKSAQVPPEIQQAFVERVAYQYWNSYNPPRSRYRAVYLHQVAPEHNLFGWLYNDGTDDMERTDVPYFICYYLAEPLHAIQLENIFTCLHKGPVALIDGHNFPETLETILLRNFWSYQPVRPGVAIALGVRKRSHIALKQGELLDLFLPAAEQDIGLKAQIYSQQKVDFSIYTHYLAEGMETDKENLQQYEQALEDIKPIAARIVRQTKAIQPLEKFAGAIKRVFVKKKRINL